MENTNEIKVLLTRIADALERIADYMSERQEAKKLSSGEQVSLAKRDSYCFINDYSEIEEFLNSRNIRIKFVRQEDEADEVLDKIAFFMGNRYSHIKALYKLIKRNLNTGRPFRLDLKSCKQDEIASVTQLCTDLHRIAFLEEYKYVKSLRYVYAKVNRIPRAINFFSGGWLERYVKSAVIRAIESISRPVPINYSYLKNPQIILPNGDDFELDIIFRIEDEFFWFEAKTGDYQKYVAKYSKVADILRLDNEHAYMILTDITDFGAQALRSLFKMNVIRIDNFYETFKQSIQHLKPLLEEELENDNAEWNNDL